MVTLDECSNCVEYVFEIPVRLVAAHVNADTSGLEDDDIRRLEHMESRFLELVANAGGTTHTLSWHGEPEFKPHPDFCELAADCYTCKLAVHFK